MDRRDFIKSGLLAAAAGAMTGPKAIAQEAERQAVREQLPEDILNYNPQMQYRPMGRTDILPRVPGYSSRLGQTFYKLRRSFYKLRRGL